MARRLHPPARLNCGWHLVISALCLTVSAEKRTVGADIDFNRDILPILSENCFACHGPDAKKRKADLRLDQSEGATRDLGEGKFAIAPGEPTHSLLVERIENLDPDEVMPPPDTGKALTASQKENLRRWIAGGAQYEAHWAFRPIEDHQPPETKESHPDFSDIDRFLLA